jgi:uncharacterized protein with LGFP repeats
LDGDQSAAPQEGGQPPVASGAIDEHHRRFGGMHGIIGAPTSGEEDLGDAARGRRRHYRSVLVGTQHNVSLKLPDTEEGPTCHAPDAGPRTPLESSVYWSPKTGAHVVTGEIRARYLEMGGHQSELGYPVSEEMPTPDERGRRSRFEFGEIWWYPETGASMKKEAGG